MANFGFIKTEPVLTSARRFEKEGRFSVYFKYFLAGLWILFLGPIKSDIFKYRFNLFKDYNYAFREIGKQMAMKFKTKLANGAKRVDKLKRKK